MLTHEAEASPPDGTWTNATGTRRWNALVGDQLRPPEAGVAVLADDDVVVHRDAERLGDIDDRRVIWMSARDGVGSPLG
jgi:hypothetical protein